MTGASDTRGDGGLAAKVLAIVVALGPPVAVSGWLRETIRDNLLLSVLVLIGYWALVGVARFLLRVLREVSELWIPRMAASVDRRLSAVFNGYRARYLRALLVSVRDVEMLGMTTQSEFSLQLRHVYVDVSLAPAPLQTTAHHPFVGAEIQGDRKTLESFLDSRQPRVFAVIGGPGSGKTTLLRRTAMALGEAPRRKRRKKRSLPLVLYLRDHVQEIVRNPGATIPELIAGVTWLKGTVTADWFERSLERGRCVVMLDGLDEVAGEGQRQLTAVWVRDQVARYPANHFVLTSRPHGYRSNPVHGADLLQVRRFTSEQIFRFVRGWYYAIECRRTGETGERTRALADDRADDLLTRMRLQPALYDLAANPMLLTMIANVHMYGGALPRGRSALYSEMCALLLHRRQEAKNLPATTGLRAEQSAAVVRKLALAMMSQQVRDVTLETATAIIGPSLARIPRPTTADEFLDELTKSGLFVEREASMFMFAHQTLQEYLAAAEIRDHPESNVLPSVVDNAWWRETILLWAANADASPVVAACLESGSVDALALAFDCADEAREVDAKLVKLLDERLYAEPLTSDPVARDAHRRLIAAVRASRSLRHTVTLSNGAVACASPLPLSLYQLYRERAGAPIPARANTAPVRAQNDTVDAKGISAAEVVSVVAWVNGLFDDGPAYRLPTRRELADPMTGVVVDLTRRTIWHTEPATSELQLPEPDTESTPIGRDAYKGPHLFVPRDVAHPYVATVDQLHETTRFDLLAVAPLLPLVLSLCLERDPERARTRNFETAMKRLKKLSRSQTPALVREPIHLDRALARTRGGNLSQDRDLIRLIDRIKDLANDLVPITELQVAEEAARDLRYTLRSTPAVREALGQALDITLTHSLQSDDVPTLAHDLQAMAPALSARRSGLVPRVLPRTSPGRMHREDMELSVVALSLLLSIWDPHRTKYRPGQAWAQFEQFLVDLLPASAELSPTLPDEAEYLLQDLRGFLVKARWEGSKFDGSDGSRDEQCWRILARRLCLVSETTTASIVRGREVAHAVTPATRIALLAGIAVADKFADGSIAATLRGIHSSLTCIDTRRDSPSAASEVVLLMRA